MRDRIVYHVVTERPMTVGQVIHMDERYESGVCRRVMEKLPWVHEIYAQPTRFSLPLEHHTAVALRELALEEVRQAEFPHLPSRLHCLYVSEERETAELWGDYFARMGRPTYHIVKLCVRENLFTGDANNCFDPSLNREENREMARNYWQNGPNPRGERYLPEMLADGEITVLEIVKEINQNIEGTDQP